MTTGAKWWESEGHKMNSLNAKFCGCPYHEKLRADAEDDKRQQAEMEANDEAE